MPTRCFEYIRAAPGKTAGGARPIEHRKPEVWEFLPAGDAFVTRQIKRQGPHWVAVRRRKEYTETLALLAPAPNIEKSRKLAEETEKRREAARAYLRHHHTSYKEDLLAGGLFGLDRDTYRDIRAQAHEEVDEFPEKHRRRVG